MFPRWLWFNHVPAGLELSAEQCAELKRRVRQMGPEQRRFTPMSRRILVRLVPATTLLSLALACWMIWLIRAQPSTGWMIFANLMSMLAFQALLWLAIAWSINRAIAPLVWRALNQGGIRVCEGCGYILDHLPRDQGQCPECGSATHPPEGPDNPPLP
jgi:hypothetical protein